MSRFYGINCFTLDRASKFALSAAMPIIDARDAITSDAVSTMDSEDYYKLAIRAFRNEKKAEDMAATLESKRMEYGLNPKTGLPNRENE